MKVSLVEPRSSFYNFYSAFVKRLPLLGPLYLGTILKNRGHDVTIHNENIKELDYSKIADSDVLAISAISTTAPRGYEIASDFKKLNPKGRVIIGGSHATFLPEEAAEFADQVVMGEGEPVICDIIEEGGERIVAGSPVQDLDDLPFPDLSLIDGFKERPDYTPISTSRGCPFDCTFCSVTAMFGRKYRFRSTDSVIEELSQRKHRHVFFYDDNFDANKPRLKELLSQMIRRKLTPPWTAQVRADVAKDDELVQLMAEANCRQLAIGFESVDPEVLKSYNKRQTPEDVARCIEVLHKHGIRIHGMFISEGYSDIYDRLGIDSLQLSILIPIIGTKLYTKVKSAGRFVADRFPSDWRLFDGGHVVHWPENMTPFEMQKQTIQALKDFYSRQKAAKMLLTGRWKDFRIRAMGHEIIRRWESQNRTYLARLKETQITSRLAPGLKRPA